MVRQVALPVLKVASLEQEAPLVDSPEALAAVTARQSRKSTKFPCLSSLAYFKSCIIILSAFFSLISLYSQHE